MAFAAQVFFSLQTLPAISVKCIRVREFSLYLVSFLFIDYFSLLFFFPFPSPCGFKGVVVLRLAVPMQAAAVAAAMASATQAAALGVDGPALTAGFFLLLSIHLCVLSYCYLVFFSFL